jgi:hypothetical protein
VPPPTTGPLLGFGALGFDAAGALCCGTTGAADAEFCVDGADCVELVDGAELVGLGACFFAAFFLCTGFGAERSAGTVPPTWTPATAAGVATLMVDAFVPGPAVAVLPPPELEMPNAPAKAAITAMSPMAIVRGSMVLGSTFSGFG